MPKGQAGELCRRCGEKDTEFGMIKISKANQYDTPEAAARW